MIMAAPPRPVTPEDLRRMPDEGRGFELVNGELKDLHRNLESCHVAGQIFARLVNYSDHHCPVWAFTGGLSYQCFPSEVNRVRRPSCSIITLDHMTKGQYYEPGHCTIAPDLVVEVIAPDDIALDVEERLEDWLSAGARIIWIVNPTTQTVRVHRGDGGYAFLRFADTLTAEEVLPGFTCPVADLFRLPGEPLPAV